MNSRKTRSAGSDELAIRNLVAKIAHAADHGEIDEYLVLFTKGASWEMPYGPRRGQPEIRAEAEQRRWTGSPGPDVPRVTSLALGAWVDIKSSSVDTPVRQPDHVLTAEGAPWT